MHFLQLQEQPNHDLKGTRNSQTKDEYHEKKRDLKIKFLCLHTSENEIDIAIKLGGDTDGMFSVSCIGG